MLVIREDQVKALERAKTEQFKQRLGDFLAARSETEFPAALFQETIDGLLLLASQSGFATERECALLAELVYRSTGGFDIEALPPASQNVLYEYKVKPQTKLERLQHLHGVGLTQGE